MAVINQLSMLLAVVAHCSCFIHLAASGFASALDRFRSTTRYPHQRKSGYFKAEHRSSSGKLYSVSPTVTEDLITSGLGNTSFNSIEHVTFVSSNKYKINEVKMILGNEYPWELRINSVDLFEPQAPPVEVSRWKCRQAAKICNSPVIVEDTSLCFNALNGLPGPYIKWFYESIGNDGLAKLLDGHEDKSGECYLSG